MTFEEMKIYDKIYSMCVNKAMEKGKMPNALLITYYDYFGFSRIMQTAIKDLGLKVILSPKSYVLKVIYDK